MARQGGRFPKRMASQAITDDDVIEALGQTVLAELRGEVALDSAMQDAMNYLPERKANLAAFLDQNNAQDRAFSDRLNNPSQYNIEDRISVINKMEDRLGGLGRLQGNVPMPLINSDSRGEQRIHTEYDINPITGVEEVVPFADPRDPTKALQSVIKTYKKGQLPDGFDEAAEYLANNAVMLASRKPSGANATNAYHRADLKVGDMPIDVEATSNTGAGKGVVPMQAYTFLNRPNDIMQGLTQGGEARWKGTSDERAFRNDATSTITQRMNDRGISGVQAIEELVDEGFFDPRINSEGVPLRQGKMFKSQMQDGFGGLGVNNKDDLISYTINPGWDSKEAYDAGKDGRYTLVQAPDSLHMLDLAKAREALMTGDLSMKLDLSRPVNYGSTRRGPARMHVMYDVPYAHPAVTDLTATRPMTQQILSSKELDRRRIG
jgi:hypothetical protein